MASRAVFKEIRTSTHISKNGGYQVQNASERKPGKSSYPLSPKKNFERTLRATHRTDRAQTSTTVSGRPPCVDFLSACANGARTKRHERKSTKNSQIQVYSGVLGTYVQAGSSLPPQSYLGYAHAVFLR